MGNMCESIRCLDQSDVDMQGKRKKCSKKRKYIRSIKQNSDDSTAYKTLRKLSKSVDEELCDDMENNSPRDPPLTAVAVPKCNIHSFNVKYIIGEGSYGKVYLVQKRDTGKY